MRPIKLTMSAFGPYGSTVEVPFSELGDRGIYLITGDTGAGKTTIFDAISYALFGETSDADRPAAALRSHFASPDLPTEVELEFSYRGECYRVTRTPRQERPRKRGEGMLTADPTARLRLPDGREVEGVSAVDAAVRELLGFDKEQFRQIAMIPQGQFRRLLTASSDDRRKIFRELFGTAPFEAVQRELKNRQMALYRSDAEAKTAIASTLRLVQLTGEERSGAFEELREHAAVKGDAVLELLRAQKRQDTAEEKRLDGEIAHLTARMSAVDASLNEAKRRERIIAELDQLEERIAELEAARARAEAARTKAESHEPEISELALRARTLTAALDDLRALEKARSEVAELEREARTSDTGLVDSRLDLERSLGSSVVLPDGSTNSSALEFVLDASRNHVAELRARGAELEGALGERARVQSELTALGENRDALVGRLRELADLEERVDGAETAEKRAAEAYARARAAADETLHLFTSFERRFLDEQAGVLAERLEPGEPCPVCGSREHPARAHRSETCPSEAEVEAARLRSEHDREAAAAASRRAGEAAARAEAAREARAEFLATKGTAEAMNGELERLAEEAARKERDAGRLAARCAERERALEGADALERRIRSAEAARDELVKHSQELAKRIASARAHAETLEQGLPVRSLAEANAQIEAAKKRMDTLNAARERARLTFDEATAAHGAATADREARRKLLAELPEARLEDIEAQRGELEARRRELADERDGVHARQSTNERAARELSSWLGRYDRLLEEHGVVDVLANAATGNLPSAAKVTFETFVQQAYLDRVIAAANRRLEIIANGRYELRRRKEASDRRHQSGLELTVLDRRTGRERDAATLSGGESFEASLSLALGLSDEVQARAGGIRLDTLFIDEGFGSLDSEALQNAIRMLTSLTPEDKLVGIISHVDALRESIDTRIVVTSGREGSSLSVEV